MQVFLGGKFFKYALNISTFPEELKYLFHTNVIISLECESILMYFLIIRASNWKTQAQAILPDQALT